MTTSAQALNEVLTFVSSRCAADERFLGAVSKFLGYDQSALSDIDALKYLVSICAQIEVDIEAVPLREEEKDHLKRYFVQFNGIRSLAHVHMNVQNAKTNFLKSDNLVGLMNIHMALSGHCHRLVLPNDTKELAADARALAEEISVSNLPERARIAIGKRLLQISSAIDHFALVGSEAMEGELEALLGAIAVHGSTAETEEDCTLLQRAFGVCTKGLAGLSAADDTMTKAISIIEKGQQFLELLPK